MDIRKSLLRELSEPIKYKNSAINFSTDPDNTVYVISKGKGYKKDTIGKYIQDYKSIMGDKNKGSNYIKLFKQIQLPKELWYTPKKTEWVTRYKPEVLEILKTIDAPDEWKKMVLQVEKIGYSAYSALIRSNFIITISIEDKFRNPWEELMRKVGNPSYTVASIGINPNYKDYWRDYTTKMGQLVDYNFETLMI